MTWWGVGGAELLPTPISVADQKAGLQLPSWLWSQVKPGRQGSVCYLGRGKAQGQWVPQSCAQRWSTEHNISPTRWLHPFHSILGWGLFTGAPGKAPTPKSQPSHLQTSSSDYGADCWRVCKCWCWLIFAQSSPRSKHGPQVQQCTFRTRRLGWSLGGYYESSR